MEESSAIEISPHIHLSIVQAHWVTYTVLKDEQTRMSRLLVDLTVEAAARWPFFVHYPFQSYSKSRLDYWADEMSLLTCHCKPAIKSKVDVD